MRFNTLDEWLLWQQSLNINAIELGLERVAEVAHRLAIKNIAASVITVAGTNGKGSTVAGYETWLHNAGCSVASYTSPHLLQYNERIKLNRQMVSDVDLCEAFEAIDQVRGDILLTYFEFGTLAALWLIQRQYPDYAILEVGLGGRLDAVNIIDADLVHLTTIGIDHQSWLGNDRETIAYEKAGVLREGIPVICNDVDLPQSVQAEIKRLNCHTQQFMHEYELQASDNNVGRYIWQTGDLSIELEPVLPGIHQLQNLAGVVAGLHQLVDLSHYEAEEIRKRFSDISLVGRFQRLDLVPGTSIFVDVGHNQDAARVLAENLSAIKKPDGRVVVLLGMLDDKDHLAFVRQLSDVVDTWFLLSIESDRGLSAADLANYINSEIQVDRLYDSTEQALKEALSSLGNQDIMLITGSFVTVEQCLLALSNLD